VLGLSVAGVAIVRKKPWAWRAARWVATSALASTLLGLGIHTLSQQPQANGQALSCALAALARRRSRGLSRVEAKLDRRAAEFVQRHGASLALARKTENRGLNSNTELPHAAALAAKLNFEI